MFLAAFNPTSSTTHAFAGLLQVPTIQMCLGDSNGFWEAKTAAIHAEWERQQRELLELQEREEIILSQSVRAPIKYDAAWKYFKTPAEINLQRVAAFWLDRLKQETQARAASSAATKAAAKRAAVAEAELEGLEAEHEMVTSRLEVMSETMALVAGRLDIMEDAMEAAEQQAELKLQRTAAFWISKLGENRRAAAEGPSAEAAAARVRLAETAVEQAQAATRAVAARAAEAAQAAEALAAMRREVDVQKVAAFWLSRLEHERAATATANMAASAQQSLAELRLSQLSEAQARLVMAEATGQRAAWLEREERRSAALAKVDRFHTALRERLGEPPEEARSGNPGLVHVSDAGKARFYRKFLTVGGAVTVKSPARVSDAALLVAADRLARMLRQLPAPVIERLARRNASMAVIGRQQQVSDLPEYRHLKGQRGQYADDALRKPPLDKRRPRPRRPRHYYGLTEAQLTADERTRGYGGLHASCGEENLLTPDTDPRYGGRDVLVHEFAHCLMDFGLTPALRKVIKEAWQTAVVARGLWRRPDGTPAYAAINEQEYFAELSMWFFGTHGEYVDAEQQLPATGPFGLSIYDPNGFEMVGSIYAGSHPLLAEVPPPAPRLQPAGGDARSRAAKDEEAGWGTEDNEDNATAADETDADVDADEVRVLELDNSKGTQTVTVFWVDYEGGLHPWGNVEAGDVMLYHTWAGHAWEVRSAGQRLRYVLPFENLPEVSATVGADLSAHSSVGSRRQ